jgi:hypothetical protein
MENKLKVLVIGIGALIVIDLLVLDFIWINQKKEGPTSGSSAVITPTTTLPSPTPTIFTSQITPPEGCSEECLTYIDQKINEAINGLPTAAPQKTIVPAQPTPSSKVSYITIGGSSSTNSTSWVDIPGTDFYFDLTDYPTAKGVRWEISLRAFLAGNKVYARLYDVTNNRAVDFSELFTETGTSTLQRSVDLAIWRGNNLYRVQGKSSTGTPAYLDSPRLRVILD